MLQKGRWKVAWRESSCSLVVFEMDSLRFQGLVYTEDGGANNNFLEKASIVAGGNRFRMFSLYIDPQCLKNGKKMRK
jgi:hypothetical protein